jgi:hypothetical protein
MIEVEYKINYNLNINQLKNSVIYAAIKDYYWKDRFFYFFGFLEFKGIENKFFDIVMNFSSKFNEKFIYGIGEIEISPVSAFLKHSQEKLEDEDVFKIFEIFYQDWKTNAEKITIETFEERNLSLKENLRVLKII